MNDAMTEKILEQIRLLKESPVARAAALPVVHHGQPVGWLDPVTWNDLQRPDAIALLAQWRQQAADSFPSQFPVTLAGTRRWLEQQVLGLSDRLLFWVTTAAEERIGHVGLYRFDWSGRHVEIDNVMRGAQGVLPGVIQAAITVLLDWTFDALNMETVFLRVFSDNARALRLYARCGFQETMRMPLARTQDGEVIRWVEVDGNYRQPVDRYFVTMRLPRGQWMSRGLAA